MQGLRVRFSELKKKKECHHLLRDGDGIMWKREDESFGFSQEMWAWSCVDSVSRLMTLLTSLGFSVTHL